MKKILPTFYIILLPLLAGCMPLKQTDIVSRSSDISGNYAENGCFNFYVDQHYWPKKYKMNVNNSYIVGPNEKKYSFFSVPNQWDIKEGRPPRYKYCLKDKAGKIKSSCEDGIWKIFVSLENEESIVTKELELKIWTFIYSPFIHGAPN